MKWIPKSALRQGIAITAIAAIIGLAVNAFHPRNVQFSFTRPSLEYAPDSLLTEDPLSDNIAGQSDSLTMAPNQSGELIVISTKQVRQLVSRGQAVLLDARTRAEYTAGHLPGARHLPVEFVYEYENQITAFPKDKWLVCYCDGPPCDLGELLAYELMLREFNRVAVYQDGLNDWKKRYPIVKGKEAGDFEK
ncbi:MAG: rhodanese-like domain-containing protein [candidate division KSB1 bacterium]|nr:rhodanese-like domain-containing protein [candidate division KSB1 bacterium]